MLAAGANSSSRRQQQSVFGPIQLHSLLSPGPGGSAGLAVPSGSSAWHPRARKVPRQHPAGPELSQLKVQAQAVSRFLDFTLGGFKRLLRVSEGGTHAGWRAGEPLILDQSQCPSLIRPWRGNEK